MPAAPQPMLHSAAPVNTAVSSHDVSRHTVALTAHELKYLIDKIDLIDRASVEHFGEREQRHLQAAAAELLRAMQQRDTTGIHQLLEQLQTTLEQFNLTVPDPRVRPSFMARLFGKGEPLLRCLQQYIAMRTQCENCITALTDQHTQHPHDIEHMDRLYEATLYCIRDLERFITAGTAELNKLHTATLPHLETSLSVNEDSVRVQTLHDLRHISEDLAQRITALQQAHDTILQLLPNIQLVQETDRALLSTVEELLTAHVPQWRQHITDALRIERALASAMQAPPVITGLSPAKQRTLLKQAQQDKRDIFDFTAMKTANTHFVATLTGSFMLLQSYDTARTTTLENSGIKPV